MNNLNPAVKDRLLAFQDLLISWNAKINLVSRADINEVWSRHIVDCLQLANYIVNKDIHLVDIGSGAGLPGIILSIAGVAQVTLIESNSKKTVFLAQAAKLSPNVVSVVNARVETLQLDCDVMTARAITSLNNIFTITKNIIVRDKCLLLKGEKHTQEINDAKKNWTFDIEIHDSSTSKAGKILAINNIRPVT